MLSAPIHLNIDTCSCIPQLFIYVLQTDGEFLNHFERYVVRFCIKRINVVYKYISKISLFKDYDFIENINFIVSWCQISFSQIRNNILVQSVFNVCAYFWFE